ncbi:MAG: site-specific integrase [Verrucomicrobia bacterium]|nr:site-specific integrase [Verrucomicrobiota bacterium]
MAKKKKNSLQKEKKETHPVIVKYFDKLLDNIIHVEQQNVDGRVGLVEAEQYARAAAQNMTTEIAGPDDACSVQMRKALVEQYYDRLEDFSSCSDEENGLVGKSGSVHVVSHTGNKDENPFVSIPSYKRAVEVKQEVHWQGLSGISVEQAIVEWLDKITNPRTKRAYEMAMQELCKKGLVKRHYNLQNFSMLNHDVTVDEIKTGKFFYEKKTKCATTNVTLSELVPWSEATRQQRAAAFISFTGHLSRKHAGIIRKALPDRLTKDKTFYRVREEVKTHAFQNRKESKRFLDTLQEINPRDCLIAKAMLQGGRRIGEVLSLETDMIDYENRQITFKQSKTKGEDKNRTVTYVEEFMNELREYVGDREGIVFITAKGTPICPQHIERNFKKVGERCGFKFRVRPHTMRASAVTQYKLNGCSDSDIHKLTGQSTEMIRMYDKSDKAENASKIVSLI